MGAPESRLGQAYRRLYELLCGRHPALRPWHFQWLSAYFLNRDLGRWLPGLSGRVLDVGCGKRPYRSLLTMACEVVGIDVVHSRNVDVVVSRKGGWPFPDRCFDAVLMTQVMEYIEDARAAMSEARRVLKPNGIAIVSFPFIYNEHGANDHLRLSANPSKRVYSGFRRVYVARQGGIGSTLATLSLNWLDTSLNSRYAFRLLRPALLPIWLPFCLLVNLAGLVMNRFDTTDAFYGNVFLVMERTEADGPDLPRAIA